MEKIVETKAVESKSEEIVALGESATLAEVIVKVNSLVAKTNAKRDRGPESKREMTENDARRITLGDLAELTHTKAAEKLELSYGQVYSARGGFTYKAIYKEWKAKNPTRGDMAGPKK